MSDQVRFLPLNIKKALAEHGSTDYANTVSAPTVVMQPEDRTPPGRTLKNNLFRRYIDGTLDVEGAAQVVIDCIHIHQRGVVPLTPLQELALSVCFPAVYSFVDPSMTASLRVHHLQISLQETFQICNRVNAHLLEELNYNTGLGGGSVPSRNNTRE